MDRCNESMVLIISSLILINLLHTCICWCLRDEVAALVDFKQNLEDESDVLSSWDRSLVNAETFWHVETDDGNSVINVDLGGLGLKGILVPELGILKNLAHLLLNNNELYGEIPVELGNLESLQALLLHDNNLSGEIPNSLGSLKNLRYLRLQSNFLNGTLPMELEKLENLLVLDLSNNQLSGGVPYELTNLKNLRYLDLSNNSLSGKLPNSLKKIQFLNVNNNPNLII